MRHLAAIPALWASVITLAANPPDFQINTGKFKDDIFPGHEGNGTVV
jgi:hypothetical protein